MLKRILCLVIISSLLSTDIVYPLNRSSSFHESRFREIVPVLAGILDFVKTGTIESEELARKFDVNINRNETGVWIDGGSWRMRVFNPAKVKDPNLDANYELIYEEVISEELNVQIYLKGLSEEDRETIRAFLADNTDVSSLARMVLEEISGAAQIGKRAKVKRVVERDGEKYMEVVDVLDEDKMLGEIELIPMDMQMLRQDRPQYQQVLDGLLKAMGDPLPQFYTYTKLIEDLFGFASPEDKVIAIHQSLARNPIAIFHEVGEYLIKMQKLRIEIKNENILVVDIAGNEFEIKLAKEAWAIASKDLDNPHYLLRALQRQIFGDEDRGLTRTIKDRLLLSGAEWISGTRQPSVRYKKSRESSGLIEDSERIKRPFVRYRLENHRYIELRINFGGGEEPYAYIESESGRVRLVNPEDRRIHLGMIATLLDMEIILDNYMEIDSPLEEEGLLQTIFGPFLRVSFDIDKMGLKKYWGYKLILSGIVLVTFITSLFRLGLIVFICATAGIIIFELMKKRGYVYEEMEFRLSRDLKKRLRQNRVVNKGVRNFINALNSGKLRNKKGEKITEADFNELFSIYNRDGVRSILIRELGVEPRAARRVVDYALRILEYKERITVRDLEEMVLPLQVEQTLIRLLRGQYVVLKGRLLRFELPGLKRIGIAECYKYMEEGRDSLFDIISNSFIVGDPRKVKLSVKTAEKVCNVLFDLYLSLGKGEGQVEFIEKVVRLDVTDIPTLRHRLIRTFKRRGEKAVVTEVIFNAVLDVMGITEGLKFLNGLKERTEDARLVWRLELYLEDFRISPDGYIPVEIEDSWRSFNLQRERSGEVPYEDVQARLLRLYMSYIRDAKEDIPRWGWTFLWLCYFEKGTRMYDAVEELLKELIKNKELDIDKLIAGLCEKYSLNSDERQKLVYTLPIDGLIALAGIYCKDILWGSISLTELEKRLKRDMDIVTGEDVKREVLFNSDVDAWLYTLRNIPTGMENLIKDKLKDEIVGLIITRLNELGLNNRCTREELIQLLELFYITRLPTTGERLIDNLSIVDMCKILFDYARRKTDSDVAIRKLHFNKNLEIKKQKTAVNLEGLKGELTGAKRLLVFTGSHSETIGLLYCLQDVLRENPNLEVRLIPQKSMWELNSTREDISAILEKEKKLPPVDMTLQGLIDFEAQGRFVVLGDCGPGFSWLKGPERPEVKGEINIADMVLGVGWDNFVSLQGLNRTCYFTFTVDNQIKQILTGCRMDEPVFVKTYGGLLASKTGRYNLYDYLTAINSDVYKELLGYFKGNTVKLHQWLIKEARRTGKSEIDIMTSRTYIEEPLKIFDDCALRDPDCETRVHAMDILLDNYERFNIRKDGDTKSVRLDKVVIESATKLDAYYLPDRKVVVLVKGDKRLIIELFPYEEGGPVFLRIGDKVYSVKGKIDLSDLMYDPVFWVGNSELVEFISDSTSELTMAPPMVDNRDIPQDINRQVPQTKPRRIYKTAEEFLDSPSGSDYMRMHYMMVLLSSPDERQCAKGMEELKRLRLINNPEIMYIIRQKGLLRVGDWIDSEIPSVDWDMVHLSNFTKAQERVLRVIGGGFLLRPPLVAMPGQGVSGRFHDLASEETSMLGIELERGNYAKGSGSVLFQDGVRHYVKKNDLLLGLFRDLLEGQMLGAIRLKEGETRIIQVPENAGILNYMKVMHHLSHIITERFTALHGKDPEPLQEFTPAIEDILIIKYMERLAGGIADGFSDFKREVDTAYDEDSLRAVFAKYGLNYSSGKDVKREISAISDMQGFSEYIEKNRLGTFISVREFLDVLIGYSRNTVNDYIRQLAQDQQVLLGGLLKAGTDEEINNILLIASLLAGCHIPKINFERDSEILTELLKRPQKVTMADKGGILDRIDWILRGEEPFSAKAVKIVGTILYRTGIRISPEERREIEEKVMDILSGEWLQTLEGALKERLDGLKARGYLHAEELRNEFKKVHSYMTGRSRSLGKTEDVELGGVDIDEIHSWGEIEGFVERNSIKRVFCDIDKTILDAPGFITTTPWFREMEEREGLAETARLWRELEEKMLERRTAHLMDERIPEILKRFRDKGIEVILYTARAEEDIPRTRKLLEGLHIDMEDIVIVTSKASTPEQKRDALIRYYEGQGWFNKESVPTIYIDDTLSNLKAVCGDKRFSHVKGLWYHPDTPKRYEEVEPSDFLKSGDSALEAGDVMSALEWYYNAFYMMSRKDIVNQVYDLAARYIGFEYCIEEAIYRFMKERLSRYRGALEKEKVWIKPEKKEEPEKEEIRWFEGAPDLANPGFLKGVKSVIVIGSHPHGDHIKGFLDYAKRKLRNLVQAEVPEPGEMRTGGPITHSLSNYWGRIGEETIVLFDLGWYPEGFVDPLIQTINPKDVEIVFVMDPHTAKTLKFKSQIEKLKLPNVRFEIVHYGKPFTRAVEKGRVLEIENYPAYHLDSEVGSSIYMVRILKAGTKKVEVVQSRGYISEVGDMFPERMDKKLLGKASQLEHIIVDGTNLFAAKGEEPIPLKEAPDKIHKYVKALNMGKFLIAHLNTTSIRMVEEAKTAMEGLEQNIPIVIIGGKGKIDELRRSYNVPDGVDYCMIGDRKVYLVDDIVGFHKRWSAPPLESVLNERLEGLRRFGWAEDELKGFVSEWKRMDAQEIREYEGPEGRIKEIERLLWDLRKTRAVVISSSQFRGVPTRKRWQNMRGFQILDAIVDKKDICILIEGRLHIQGEEGTVLRVLLDKKKERTISSITGRKKVKATIDSQWRSGHITFKGLMDLLNLIADEAVKEGNVYDVRTYIPVPEERWFRMIPAVDADTLLARHGRDSLESVIDIIKRWNNRGEVTNDEIYFAKEVIVEIFKNPDFFQQCLGIGDTEGLKSELIKRLALVERDIKLRGRANIKVFIASTSKFVEVLHGIKIVTDKGIVWSRQLAMDPAKLEELFKVANRFISFEVGVSYEHGKTIDLVQRRLEEYSVDYEKKLGREYLRALYRETAAGRFPRDLGLYLEEKAKEDYKVELEEIMKKAEGEEVWKDRLKTYVESQFLRLGFRHVFKCASINNLRMELSNLYDVVIQSVCNYLKLDITIIAGGDYAQEMVLFKDIIRLGIETDKRDVLESYKRMEVILKGLGIPVRSGDYKRFLHRRVIVPGEKKELKGLPAKDILTERKKRFSKDEEVLGSKGRFDIQTGPGGLDDIELIRHFFNPILTDEERDILNDAEEFLRRYKEEMGYSTGGDETKANQLFGEVMANLDFKGSREELMEEFFMMTELSFRILQRVVTEGKPKNLSFGDVDEERDIHGAFEKADSEGRILTDNKLLRSIIEGNPALEGRRYKIIREEPGKPTMFYRDEPFASVLSHGGRRTNTIYIGLNTLRLVEERPEYRNALLQLLLHENRDIERGYHMDLEDEVNEDIIKQSDANSIYRLWYDLITDGRFGEMYRLYMERSGKRQYKEYFLKGIPVDIKLVRGNNLYEFRHGDAKDLPDSIGLNLELFRRNYSTETQVFLLRHCTDRVRYDGYKTIINDVKYLKKLASDERRKILRELEGEKYGRFLMAIVWYPLEEAKKKIREYVGLRFDTYTSPDGANVWYAVGGNSSAKRTLVFLHGIGINSRDWRPQITFLEDYYRIITIDLRGFGKSKGLGTERPDIKNYARDVEGILTRECIKDAILVGHSMGGMVALNLDADRPVEEKRIKGLVLIASTAGDPTESFIFKGFRSINFKRILRIFLVYLKWLEPIWASPYFKKIAKSPLVYPFIEMLFERFVFQKGTDPLFVKKVIRSIFRNELKALIYGFRAIMKHDVEDMLDRLGVPVLWIIGRGDMMVLSGEQIEDAGKVRDCRIVKVPEGKHYPHARFPRRVNKEIYNFADTGIYSFSQLVCKEIKERYSVDVSLDELGEELKSVKIRFIPRIRGATREDLRLIDDISGIVRSCGLETNASDEMMIKAVIIIARQIIPRQRTGFPPARAVTREELEDRYSYIVQSV